MRMKTKYFVIAVVSLLVLSASTASGQEKPINGTKDNDVLNGTGGKDKIHGHGGNDTINSGGGNDKVFGGPGNDTVNAGPGDDKVWGGPGNDTINGEAGRDTIRGGPGNDTIDGGTSDDRIWGGPGDDTIDGGLGNDRIRAGPGTDTYNTARNDGNDNIVLDPDDVPEGDVEMVSCGSGKDTVWLSEGFSLRSDFDPVTRMLTDPSTGGKYSISTDCETIREGVPK